METKLRLACLCYEDSILLAPTDPGTDAWIAWMRDKQPTSIETRAMVGPTALPDFPRISCGMLAHSERAAKVLGSGFFEMTADLGIDGAPGYKLGATDYARAYFVSTALRLQVPLTPKVPLASFPVTFFETGGSFAGLQGEWLVREDVWHQIRAAGLTGLKCVEVYEFTEAD